MTVVKCNMLCTHISRKNNCKLKVMEFNEFGCCSNMQFDSKKAFCVDCNESNIDEERCEFDGHKIKECSRCTNGAYDSAE